jgi:hypothetical protein
MVVTKEKKYLARGRGRGRGDWSRSWEKGMVSRCAPLVSMNRTEAARRGFHDTARSRRGVGARKKGRGQHVGPG